MLHLPRRFTDHEIPSVLQRTVASNLTPRAAQRVEVGFDRLGTIHAEGVVVLFNLVEWLRAHGIDCIVRPPREPLSWANDYLDQAGFFLHATGSRIKASNTPLHSHLPLEFVRNEQSEMWVRQRLPTWLARHIGATPEELDALRIGVGEVFNNVADHSGEAGSCAFAQFYRNEATVRIAISDFGVGIPANVRRRERDLDDTAALRRSVEHGFSTQTTPRNRGAGLHTLLEQVVLQKHGTASILSGGARLRASRDEGALAIVSTSLGAGAYYPGTLLTLTLPTSTLADPVEESDQLEWS